MKFRVTGQGWPLGAVVCPPGVVIDSTESDYFSLQARGLTPPLNSIALDEEAWQAQLAAYPDAKHLLGGGWQ